MTNKSALLIIPHQDDEFFILPYLEYLIKCNRKIFVIFITNGKYDSHDPIIRMEESKRTLTHYGIKASNIINYGYDNSLEDAQIPFKMTAVHRFLNEFIDSHPFEISEVIAPAWEGGHQDHDALNRIILNILRKKNKTNILRQYYLYNSFNISYPFYRVMHPTLVDNNTIIFNIPFISSVRAITQFINYKSQFKTFIGLIFPAIYQFLFIRKIFIQIPDDISDFRDAIPPHAGILFYERRGRFTFKEMIENLQNYKRECM